MSPTKEKGSAKQAKKTLSNKELLVHWATVILHQQVWVAQIVQSLGAPLLPGQTNQILQNLSVKHLEAWLKDGAPLELVAGLLNALIEDQAIGHELYRRLTGQVVSKLLDARAGQATNSDTLNENVRALRSIFKIERVQDDRPDATSDDHQEARSNAYADACEELYKQTELVLTEPWSLPATENAFESALFARWQEHVLPALKRRLSVGLPILVNPEAVNYIPARVKMDKIDRARHQSVDTMGKTQLALDNDAFLQFVDDFLQRENSAENTAIEAEDYQTLWQQIDEAAAQVTANDAPPIREAVKLVLRGERSQKEASETYNVPKSTLNDRTTRAKERIIKIRQSG